MIEFYSIESRKGGVGKTTIALNLAKSLVKHNKDVLFIDCDITGTPISKAAAHSAFWKDDVRVANQNGKPYNLIDLFVNRYLKGQIDEGSVIDGLNYHPKKIHIIGSEIYSSDGQLLIDPRDLMDDLHSYWFTDLLKSVVSVFSQKTKQVDKAIILDNSPGYVGIGRSVREWLSEEDNDHVKFVLVSSLDEQDIDSTILSAAEIAKIMNWGEKELKNIKVVINKAPKELLDDNGGYVFKRKEDDNWNKLVDALLPLSKNNYPMNIIKYESVISGQFIEANLIPKRNSAKSKIKLERSFRSFENKIQSYEQKQDPYSDINSIDYYYRQLLKELSNSGYNRMSKSLQGDFFPKNRLKDLKGVTGKLRSIPYSDDASLDISRSELEGLRNRVLASFLKDINIPQYTLIITSLNHGLYKIVGLDRKDANLTQMYNLTVYLIAYYDILKKYCADIDGFTQFLKFEVQKGEGISLDLYDVLISKYMETFNMPIIFNVNSIHYLNTLFGSFYDAMNIALLGMINCKQDYELILNACKDTMNQGAKMINEDLMEYIKCVVSKRTLEYDDNTYQLLVRKPIEMKAIQTMIESLVLV